MSAGIRSTLYTREDVPSADVTVIFAVPGSEAGSATETVSPSAGVPTICGVALYWTGIGPYCVTAGSKPATERPATLRSTSAGSSPSPTASSSVIWKNPALVPGDGLVISTRSCVVLTGSNASVDGWLVAAACVTTRLLTGFQAPPSQYVTLNADGNARIALPVGVTVKYGRSAPTVCAVGQDSETHSLACAFWTFASSAVAALLYALDQPPVAVVPSSIADGIVAAAPEKLASALPPRRARLTLWVTTSVTVTVAVAPGTDPCTVKRAQCDVSTASQVIGMSRVVPSLNTCRTVAGSVGLVPTGTSVPTGSSGDCVEAVTYARAPSEPCTVVVPAGAVAGGFVQVTAFAAPPLARSRTLDGSDSAEPAAWRM